LTIENLQFEIPDEPFVRLLVLPLMPNSEQSTESKHARGSSLAKPLAPEEIRMGDFVTPLHVFYDFPSFFWNDCAMGRREETVRVCYIPETGGVPLKVKSICLPFVLAEQPSGEQQTLDVRKVRLARLDARYAKAAWKVCKKKKADSCKRI
jgi:hypothetical protein